jgi:hypothetical protein
MMAIAMAGMAVKKMSGRGGRERESESDRKRNWREETEMEMEGGGREGNPYLGRYRRTVDWRGGTLIRALVVFSIYLFIIPIISFILSSYYPYSSNIILIF